MNFLPQFWGGCEVWVEFVDCRIEHDPVPSSTQWNKNPLKTCLVCESFRLVDYLAQICRASNSSSSSPRGSSASEPIPTLYTYLHSPQAPLDKECYYRRKHQQSPLDTGSWPIRVCLHQLILGKIGGREGDV